MTLQYPLLLSDIDGTLLDSAHNLSPNVIAAVQEYAAAGGRFVLASARPPLAMTGIAATLDIAIPMVSLNGAYVCQVTPLGQLEQVIDSRPLATSVYSAFMAACQPFTDRISVNVFSDFDWYIAHKDAWVMQEERITGTEATIHPLDDLTDRPVHKILCMGDEAVITQLAKLIASHPEWPLSATRSKATYLEVVAAGVSKASALRRVATFFGVSLAQTMAMGDGENDLPMLEAAGLGVTLRNALPAVLAAIPTVVSDNDHDGAAEAIHRFALPRIGLDER